MSQFHELFRQVWQQGSILLYIDEAHIHRDLDLGYTWAPKANRSIAKVPVPHWQTASTGMESTTLPTVNASSGTKATATKPTRLPSWNASPTGWAIPRPRWSSSGIAPPLSGKRHTYLVFNSSPCQATVPTATPSKVFGSGCGRMSPNTTVIRPCANSLMPANRSSDASTWILMLLSNVFGPNSTWILHTKNYCSRNNVSLGATEFIFFSLDSKGMS